MEKLKIVNFPEYKSNKNYYYAIGLVLGALRAELEAGIITVEDVYSLLTDDVKSAISDEVAIRGVAR